MKSYIPVVMALFVVGPAEAKDIDGLCSQLNALEKAAAYAPKKEAAWVDVYWNFDSESIFSIACSHRGRANTEAFCSWVPGNVSMEFLGRFPERILDCYSIKPNPYKKAKFSKRDLKFKTEKRSTIVVQTNYLPSENGLPWMRLVIFPKGVRVSDTVLPDPRPYDDEGDKS